jgi:ribonucleoside-diphosphate reductase alpha chain
MTRNPEVRFAKSIVDYIFRWMATKFLSKQAQFDAGVNMAEPSQPELAVADQPAPERPSTVRMDQPKGVYAGAAIQNQEDAPPCSTCGSIMIRSGSCYKCANCGTTSGCA